MGISSTLKKNVFHTDVTGDIFYDDISRHMEYMATQKLSSDTFVEIVNLCDIGKFRLNSKEALAVTKEAAGLHDQFSTLHVVIIQNRAFVYGIVRMLATYVSLANPAVKWHYVKDNEEAELLAEKLTR